MQCDPESGLGLGATLACFVRSLLVLKTSFDNKNLYEQKVQRLTALLMNCRKSKTTFSAQLGEASQSVQGPLPWHRN